MSAQALFEKIITRFSAESAEGLNAVYGFEVEGEALHAIKIENNKCRLLTESENASPDVTLKASKEIWEQIINGSMPAQMAFMMGKLQITGEFPLALKLPSLFSF
jgi:putative sterol carrier protein